MHVKFKCIEKLNFIRCHLIHLKPTCKSGTENSTLHENSKRLEKQFYVLVNDY